MKIRKWTEFQHFKDRNPPWIKLHKNILDQRDISVISDRSFRVLVGLWLLASEDTQKQGILPEIDDIAFRLRIDKSELLKSLQELKHFIDDYDITMISSGYQGDNKPISLTRSQETETETETETTPPLSPPRKKAKSKAFKKPTPAEVDAYSASRPDKPDIPGDEFCDSYEAKGWKIGKSPMKDWKAAVRTWESNRKREINNAAHQQIPGRRQTETEIHGKIYRDMLASQLGNGDIREDANPVSPALDEIAWN